MQFSNRYSWLYGMSRVWSLAVWNTFTSPLTTVLIYGFKSWLVCFAVFTTFFCREAQNDFPSISRLAQTEFSKRKNKNYNVCLLLSCVNTWHNACIFICPTHELWMSSCRKLQIFANPGFWSVIVCWYGLRACSS